MKAPNVTPFRARQPTLEELDSALHWCQMAEAVVALLIEKRRGRELDAVELAHFVKVLRGPRDE